MTQTTVLHNCLLVRHSNCCYAKKNQTPLELNVNIYDAHFSLVVRPFNNIHFNKTTAI